MGELNKEIEALTLTLELTTSQAFSYFQTKWRPATCILTSRKRSPALSNVHVSYGDATRRSGTHALFKMMAVD